MLQPLRFGGWGGEWGCLEFGVWVSGGGGGGVEGGVGGPCGVGNIRHIILLFLFVVWGGGAAQLFFKMFSELRVVLDVIGKVVQRPGLEIV